MLNVAENPSSQRPTPADHHQTSVHEPDGDYDDGLLANAVPIMATVYALTFVVLLFTFDSDTESFFHVVIAAGVFLLFFILPFAILRQRRLHDERWHSEREQTKAREVTTWTGHLKRNEALAQIIIIPLAMTALFLCFAFVWMIEGGG
jgi:uncharacterized membrane protein YhaH (DUF805 family)